MGSFSPAGARVLLLFSTAVFLRLFFFRPGAVFQRILTVGHIYSKVFCGSPPSS